MVVLVAMALLGLLVAQELSLFVILTNMLLRRQPLVHQQLQLRVDIESIHGLLLAQ